MRLKDKVAIVTGSARGIGFCVAQAFARERAIVAIADINLDGAKAAAERLTGTGGRAMPLAVNVADQASVQAMVDAVVAAHGRVGAGQPRRRARLSHPRRRAHHAGGRSARTDGRSGNT